MHYTICLRCYAVLPREVFSCPSCNTWLEPKKIGYVKLCKHDGTPIPVSRHFCTTCGVRVRGWYVPWWNWLALVIALSIVATILLAQLHQYTYTTYQLQTCIITNRTLSASSDKNGNISYQPDLAYEVIRRSSHQTLVSGDGALGLASFNDLEDAQQIINQYQVGFAYPCWYSPVASPDVLLIRPDFPDTLSWEAVIWLFGSGALFLLLGWCLVHLFFYPLGLRRRMVGTLGKVVAHEHHTTKNGSSIVSIIAFKTQTEPSLTCCKKHPGEKPLGTQMNVCYDWRYPAQNARLQSLYTKNDLLLAITAGIFLIGLFLPVFSGWFIWLAFQF